MTCSYYSALAVGPVTLHSRKTHRGENIMIMSSSSLSGLPALLSAHIYISNKNLPA